MKKNSYRIWVLRFVIGALAALSFYLIYYSVAAGRPRSISGALFKGAAESIARFSGSFVGPDGQARGLMDYTQGRPAVLTFVYRECGMSCPVIMGDLKALASGAEYTKKDVAFLIVFFDDAAPTIAQTRAFFEKYDIPWTGTLDGQWITLAADRATVRSLADLFALRYTTEDISGTINYAHSNFFAAISPAGAVTEEFRSIVAEKKAFFGALHAALGFPGARGRQAFVD